MYQRISRIKGTYCTTFDRRGIFKLKVAISREAICEIERIIAENKRGGNRNNAMKNFVILPITYVSRLLISVC